MSTADSLRQHGSNGQLLFRRSFARNMRWDADLPIDLVERMWHEPHALLAEGEKLQEKPRCCVVQLAHPAGPFVWKHHNWGTIYRAVKRTLAQSVAHKCWSDARFLRTAGIPTPRVRAVVEGRFGPFQRNSYLLIDYVEGMPLYHFIRFERPSTELIHHLAKQVAAIWQLLDDVCVWHNDFKTDNLLVDRDGKVWLIDFERTRRFRSRKRLRRRQVRDIHEFFHPRNWRASPAAAELFRQEFLKTRAIKETLAGPRGAGHPLQKARPRTNRPAQLFTAVITCRNAVDTIASCIESTRDTVDEIIVADSGSTDGTLSVIKNIAGCRVIHRQCDDEIEFAKWADGHAQHPWIFRLFPNEQLNAELSRQVQIALAAEPEADGFRIFRNPYFRGRLLKYGGHSPDSSIRIYRKGAVQYELRGGRAEVVLAPDRFGELTSRLPFESHYCFERSLSEMVSLAKHAAHQAQARGIRPTRQRALFSASSKFVHSYLLRSGWLDGWAGLHASCLAAFNSYLGEAMLWELNQPAMPERILSWQGLKLFDPTTSASVPAALAQPVSATDAEQAISSAEPQPLRHAA